MSSLPTDAMTVESMHVEDGPARGGVAVGGGVAAGGGVPAAVGGGVAAAVGGGNASDGTGSGPEANTLVDVLMPKMGSSVVEGTVVGWNVSVGDAVVADQALCVISTDKVDSDAPSPASGTLVEILVEDGETVDVGTAIARIAVGDGATHGDPGPVAPAAGSASSSADQGDTTRQGAGGSPQVAGAGTDIAVLGDPRATRREALRRSSPVATKIATAHGIDVLALTGSGRNGRVTKADVLHEVERLGADGAATASDGSGGGKSGTPRLSAPEAHAEPPMHIETPYRRDPNVPVAGQGPASPSAAQVGTRHRAAEDRAAAPAAASPSAAQADTRHRATGDRVAAGSADEGTVVPLDRMRTAIGRQMRRALDTAAHATTIVECDMSRIERQRRELGTTALPLVARHVLDTLRDFPALNATYDGETLTRFDRVHLGVAVSLGDDGLIVPVIHDAQDLSAAGIAHRIKDVAGRARSGELSADDVRGGTFTITNPGAAGALVATPIINVPQVAILDLEAIVKRAVVVTDADGQDSIAIRPMTHLCMSWDHRVLDGMYAARFLTALRGRIEGRG